MGIYIKGMEMPKSCGNCFYDKQCDIWRKRNWGMPPPDDCPLVPVPPHGDLIDRAEIVKCSERIIDHADKIKPDVKHFVDVKYIQDASTIIPATEDE